MSENEPTAPVEVERSTKTLGVIALKTLDIIQKISTTIGAGVVAYAFFHIWWKGYSIDQILNYKQLAQECATPISGDISTEDMQFMIFYANTEDLDRVKKIKGFLDSHFDVADPIIPTDVSDIAWTSEHQIRYFSKEDVAAACLALNSLRSNEIFDVSLVELEDSGNDKNTLEYWTSGPPDIRNDD